MNFSLISTKCSPQSTNEFTAQIPARFFIFHMFHGPNIMSGVCHRWAFFGGYRKKTSGYKKCEVGIDYWGGYNFNFDFCFCFIVFLYPPSIPNWKFSIPTFKFLLSEVKAYIRTKNVISKCKYVGIIVTYSRV